MANVDQIKQLREETNVSILECKKALEEAKGDIKIAKEILQKRGIEFAKKKTGREAKEGIIETYVHSGKKVGAMIELNCETDFVARSETFQKLAHEICLQVAALNPEEFPIFEQPWIKDETKNVRDLINECITKLGENVVLSKFIRYEL